MKLYRQISIVTLEVLLTFVKGCQSSSSSSSSGITSFVRTNNQGLQTTIGKMAMMRKTIAITTKPSKEQTVTAALLPFNNRGGGGTSTKIERVNPLKLVPTDIIFDNAPFVQSTQVIVGANLLGFVISLVTGSHIHLDLIGTGAFAVASFPSILGDNNPLRTQISGAAVTVWSTKLASFLFYRALKVKHDARLDATLSTVGGTAIFWIISTMWGVVCSLPHTLGTTSSDPGNNYATGVGTVMYIIGLVIETIADTQKWMFKNTPQTSSQFCNIGLWSLSQHPNWFGNLVMWFGIVVMNFPALGWARGATSLLSPLFMWTLFYGQASGAMTPAVELAKAKYGDDPKFLDYIKNVPLIVPRLFRRNS